MRVFGISVLLMTLTAEVLSLSASAMFQEPLWKQIAPLRSTRFDVEKLFGQPKKQAHVVSYPVPNGTLEVEYYAFDHCKPSYGYYGEWSISEWTVVEITYTPDRGPQLTSLNLNLAEFRKVYESPDVPGLISYVNDADGVDYTFQADGTLNDIRYFPRKREDGLRCSARPKRLRKGID